jgi:putative membrane protein
MILTEDDIYAIERPHPRLMTLYILRAFLSGPLVVFSFPYLFFRYHTLRYKFDAEGIHMRWGLLFRRQINLTYARIQDIHLTSGLLQRWLGLADLNIQTASGSSGAEMSIEGLLEYEAVRDYLYTRMRGYRQQGGAVAAGAAGAGAAIAPAAGDPRVMELLGQVVAEMRATRMALEKLGSSKPAVAPPTDRGAPTEGGGAADV